MMIKQATINHIQDIISLAQITWRSTYASLVPGEQLDYMLNTFYQPSLLEHQMTDPEHHLLVAISEEKLLGYSHCIDLGIKQKISKLYVLPNQQGLGIGKKLIEAIEKDAIEAGLFQLELCVNRGNPAQHFYEKMGFHIVREEDFPVGDFWMNDYVMQKNLSPKMLQP